jgi:hypothetical protein
LPLEWSHFLAIKVSRRMQWSHQRPLPARAVAGAEHVVELGLDGGGRFVDGPAECQMTDLPGAEVTDHLP